MYDIVDSHFSTSVISVFAAAVCDYRPKTTSINKIKKRGGELDISFVENADILASMASKKKDNQFIVGFALETDNEISNAKKKLLEKNVDMIVLNSLKDEGAGFQSETNKITILDKKNNIFNFDLKDKVEVAKDIIEKIIELS